MQGNFSYSVMDFIKTKSLLSQMLDCCENQKSKIKNQKLTGFVPTMGALHRGHISLVEQCRKENDVTVVSIFVNPTQFNNTEDLANYPRTIDEDLEKLASAGCDIVFAPAVAEMYPEEDKRIFDFGTLDKVMEGKHRPGHFNGVAQVVSRLFDIVKPDKAYFGEKDFQQLAIIRELVRQLDLKIRIAACPIVREKDGLAMSSRNRHLDENQRKQAVVISKTLFESRKIRKNYSVTDLKQWVKDKINAASGLHVEYFEIIDGFTLQPIDKWEDTDYSVGCVAVFSGDIRLIDNVSYLKNAYLCCNF